MNDEYRISNNEYRSIRLVGYGETHRLGSPTGIVGQVTKEADCRLCADGLRD
jgi:hypothetical protein